MWSEFFICLLGYKSGPFWYHNDPLSFIRNVPHQLAEKQLGPFKKSGAEAYKRSILPFY